MRNHFWIAQGDHCIILISFFPNIVKLMRSPKEQNFEGSVLHIKIPCTTVCIHVPFPHPPPPWSSNQFWGLLILDACFLFSFYCSSRIHFHLRYHINLLSVQDPVGIMHRYKFTWLLSEALSSSRTLWHPCLCSFPSLVCPTCCPTLPRLPSKILSWSCSAFFTTLCSEMVVTMIVLPACLLDLPPESSPELGLIVLCAHGVPLLPEIP